ncbi:aminotransferase class I/II-fold pyridoxal phosphate-dependent enzyme [Desulfococcaceae bacterium HSG8]|nr:aminotransferase class I/II-fold pyridoxal phosphate-dependent enzyme [Desulfococcaceae bacterium HSG8]
MKKVAKETEIVHGTHSAHSTSMDLVPPIHMTSTFRFKNADHGAGIFQGTSEGYVYTRISNPTVDLLQEKIAVLEQGESAIATSSGMSAIASVSLALAKPGDNFIACSTVYGGTFALFNKHLRDFKIEPRFVYPSSYASKDRIEALVDENTRFLYMETPANPTLDVADIGLWASVAKPHNIPLIVDNTFASPYLQRPLTLGADIVVHSATKYLGGHGDLIGGIIVGTKKMTDHIREEYVTHYGPIMSPFNAWLISRGIKTLAVRMEKHSSNALKIAQWLEGHSKVKKVYYPGLVSHSGHHIAKKQMKKFGGMIAFEVKGGIPAGKIIMDNVKLCILAVSLGDCETLIQHPASMTHSTYTREERAKAGISDGLIRLSVGIEDPDDIIADLDRTLSL